MHLWKNWDWVQDLNGSHSEESVYLLAFFKRKSHVLDRDRQRHHHTNIRRHLGCSSLLPAGRGRERARQDLCPGSFHIVPRPPRLLWKDQQQEGPRRPEKEADGGHKAHRYREEGPVGMGHPGEGCHMDLCSEGEQSGNRQGGELRTTPLESQSHSLGKQPSGWSCSGSGPAPASASSLPPGPWSIQNKSPVGHRAQRRALSVRAGTEPSGRAGEADVGKSSQMNTFVPSCRGEVPCTCKTVTGALAKNWACAIDPPQTLRSIRKRTQSWTESLIPCPVSPKMSPAPWDVRTPQQSHPTKAARVAGSCLVPSQGTERSSGVLAHCLSHLRGVQAL